MNRTRDCPQVAAMRPFLMQKRQEESALDTFDFDLCRFDDGAGGAVDGATDPAPAAKTAEDISAAFAGLEDGEEFLVPYLLRPVFPYAAPCLDGVQYLIFH